MNPQSQFATSQGIDPANVTHCVRIGCRGPLTVYAVGWWCGTYNTATIAHDGTRFVGDMRVTYDMDIERLEE